MEKSCSHCGKPVDSHGAKGYCATCYARYRRNGTADKRVPMAAGNCTYCGEMIGPKGAKGYCAKHYARFKKHGDPSISLIDREHAATCSECDEPPVAKGYCPKHYQRWSKWGDPAISLQQVRGICAFPACGLPHDSHGYCTSHARQLRQGRELSELLPRGTWTREVSERIARHIERNATRLGRPRKYPLDETYFDEITDEHRAYWLGFITADGGITEIAAGRPGVLRVELAEYDDGHLLNLSAALGSNRPLGYSRTFACASFGSRYLADSLGRLGIGPRKSATVEPWDGPGHLMPHYWRGLFDGDGGICFSGGYWHAKICGSKACVETFADWARPICGSRAKAIPTSPGSTCWQWQISANFKAQLLVRALYENAPVVLERKRVLAEKLCAIDFDQMKAQTNTKRAAAMRDAWATGRHPRAKKM